MHPHFMHPHFIVVTDRGALRAGWIEPDPLGLLFKDGAEGGLMGPPPGRMPVPRPARIRWVASLDFVHPRQHFVEQVTDLSGNYSAVASSGIGGAPRRMQASASDVHWKLEADRRAVEDLARAIEEVLLREKPEAWSLSAPADIHGMLEEAVAPHYREHLLGVIPKNLVRADSASLLEHFVPRRPSAAHTSPEESA
jgi:hypothetical protein